MTTPRTVEDRLRNEYFRLLPELQAALVELDARSKYAIMPIALRLQQRHERLILHSRVKDCESAIGSLRRKQEGKVFDEATPEKYQLASLPDLVGVRVLVFPSAPINAVRAEMASAFPSWQADNVHDPPKTGPVIAWKHHGRLREKPSVECEYQVVPMLIGLFWDVEHAAIYKPDPKLLGVTREPVMQERTRQVYAALREFEEEFARRVDAAGR